MFLAEALGFGGRLWKEVRFLGKYLVLCFRIISMFIFFYLVVKFMRICFKEMILIMEIVMCLEIFSRV